MKFISVLFLTAFISADTEQSLWIKANDLFKMSKYSAAAKTFLKIEDLYPASPKLKQALLFAAKSFFLSKNYVKTIEIADLLKELDPQYSEKNNVDELLINSYYKLLQRPERENKYLNLIMNLSDKDSAKYKQIRQKCIDILAYDNLTKGLLYSQKGSHIVALKYYGKIILDHHQSNFTAEAYFRCAEIFHHLNLISDRDKCIKALSIRYSASTWHDEAIRLLEAN